MTLAKEEAKMEMKMKVMVDKAANRVLFAEAGKDFVDFLFQIQELPLGVVSQLVLSVSDNSIGCVSNVRDSINKLPDRYFISTQKAALLDPEVRNCGMKLKVSLKQHAPEPRTLYGCTYEYCNHHDVSDNPHAYCSGCHSKLSTTTLGQLVTPSDEAVVAMLDGEGGYVKGSATFMVTDDLAVKPMLFGSCLDLLKEYNVGRVGDIEEMVVDVGLDECKMLLEAALRSKTALTDTFLSKKASNIAPFPL